MADRQDRAAPNETGTGGYTIYNLFGGFSIPGKGLVHRVTVRLENVTDKLYHNHVSHTKDIVAQQGGPSMRKQAGRLFSAAAIALIAMPALAQSGSGEPQMTPEQKAEMEAYMKAGTPGAPHLALASMAGTYDLRIKSWHEPGGPPMEDRGTAARTMMLEGRVLVEKFNGTMMGTPFTGHGMTGYDNVTGKYWSTWNDSMSTGLMVSEGTCDAQARNCTFIGSWNDPIKKAPVKARMTTRWPSPTTEIFEMHGPGRDGKEMKMMEITYTKK